MINMFTWSSVLWVLLHADMAQSGLKVGFFWFRGCPHKFAPQRRAKFAGSPKNQQIATRSDSQDERVTFSSNAYSMWQSWSIADHSCIADLNPGLGIPKICNALDRWTNHRFPWRFAAQESTLRQGSGLWFFGWKEVSHGNFYSRTICHQNQFRQWGDWNPENPDKPISPVMSTLD